MAVSSSAADWQRLAGAVERLVEATRASNRDADLAPIEKRLATALRKAWAAQGKAFLEGFAALKTQLATTEGRRRLREAGDTPDWQPIWDDAAGSGDGDMEDALNAGAEDALTVGGTATADSFTLANAFDLSNPGAVRYLDKYAADLVTQIDDTTRDTLNRLITGGVQQGLGYEKIAALLRDQFDNWAEPQAHIRDRAEMVAVTEIGKGYEAGARVVIQGLQDQGLEMEKQWLPVDDPCDICAANADQDWIAADDAFDSGDDTPPGHPSCRCTTLYRRVNSDGSTTDEGEGEGGE